MNMNDFRANAYGRFSAKDGGAGEKFQKAADNKAEIEKKVKPFMPQKLSSVAGGGYKPAETGLHSDRQAFIGGTLTKLTSQENPYEKAQKKRAEKETAHQRLDSATDFLKSGGLIKVPGEPDAGEGRDSVYRRVAKFLLIIGEDEAARILPHLSEDEIAKIVPEIASIRSVSKEEASVILEEFNGLAEKAKSQGGVGTAREMLEKAYGKARADQMLKKAMPMQGLVPFKYLANADNERVYLLLKDENPGVQSLVLSRLEPKKAAAIINLMKADEKKEVVVRLAKMEPVLPEVLRRVDQAMQEKFSNQTVEKAEVVDGRKALANILKKMDVGTEKDILSYLSDDDPDLGQDLRSRLFTIDDVVKADDRFVQEKLREMEERDIAYLIAAKPDDFRDKILDNVSAGRRQEVLAQEDILKPMRRSDCDRITAEFFGKLRRAYEEGHLIIKDRNDDVYVD